MADVFCNNCGHRNPPGSNFCSSCGAILETAVSENTTITFHPTLPTDPVEEDVIVEVGEITDDAVMVVMRGSKAGSRFVLDEPVTTAGRHPDSDIFLDDITVSRRHAEVIRTADGYLVRDVGSLNGTYVNRERIDESDLASGDEVQVGKFKLVFYFGAGEAP